MFVREFPHEAIWCESFVGIRICLLIHISSLPTSGFIHLRRAIFLLKTFKNKMVLRVFDELKLRQHCYRDDWTVTFSSFKNFSKVLSASIYILFTNVAPAVTFASFLIEKTDRKYGAIDVLLSTGANGIFYALFAGQPLVIVGVTGPVSIFLETLYFLNKQFINTAFLPFVFWIGIWAAFIHIILGLTGSCSIVKYVTPFTCEVFSAFIGCIYIYTGVQQVYAVFLRQSISSGLLVSLLAILTVAICHAGTNARSWKSFTKTIRGTISDYIIPFTIVFVTLLYKIPLLNQVSIDLLKVQPEFGPSNGRFRFLVNPLETPPTLIFAAILPAIILTILIFFDHNVSSLLSQKQFGVALKKPAAYNWDFIIIGISMAVTGLFGLPFTHGLIPQAPLHVLALTETVIVDSDLDIQPQKFTYNTIEQRFSNLFQSILTLLFCSINVLLAALGSIPVSTLNGLLIFMGFQAFRNNRFTSRLYTLVFIHDLQTRNSMEFWPSSVKLGKVWGFVGSQFLMLLVIFGVTISPLAILFPIAITVTVCIRMCLGKWIDKSDLEVLDEGFVDDDDELVDKDEEEEEEISLNDL
jgi:boron transporter